eukprot:2692061-Pyramimonas_sp.AAC.2
MSPDLCDAGSHQERHTDREGQPVQRDIQPRGYPPSLSKQLWPLHRTSAAGEHSQEGPDQSAVLLPREGAAPSLRPSAATQLSRPSGYPVAFGWISNTY